MFTIGKNSFVVANSNNLRNAIYRLRYKVYVEEFGFEKAEDHLDGYEIDEYDSNSIHFAALNEKQEVIGTLRMILHSEKGFPIEHAAKITFFGESPAPHKIIEVSRLAVSKGPGGLKEDGFHGVEFYPDKTERKRLVNNVPIPEGYHKRKRALIALGLYRLLYQTTKRMGITHWYMIAEKKLFYALKRVGFLFYQIGEPVNYHGIRIPYLGILKDIDQYLLSRTPHLFKFYSIGRECRPNNFAHKVAYEGCQQTKGMRLTHVN
jgi:N-acyl amino acid synthase of PEP-CTERM/exosortase system